VNTDSRSDAEVIAASWDDIEEFGIIFRRHYDPVFAFVARRIHRSEAADLTSEVFVKAMTSRRRYDTSRAHALPWLYGIASNTIGDRMRKIKHGRRAYLAVGAGRDPELREDLADDRLVAADVHDSLLDEIQRLAKGAREALLLSALEGLTYSEIAEMLGVSPATVGSRLSRARRRIRERIPDLDQKTDHMTKPKSEKDVG
jgi:RNA polymerase sigma-70 factor, ECF subfamily